MADLNNIKGWKRELISYQSSKEWKALKGKQKMPVEWLPEMAQIVLGDAELKKAFTVYGNWIVANHLHDENDNPIPLDSLPDDYPGKESDIASWFAIWFFNIGKGVQKIIPTAGSPPAPRA